MDVDVEFVDVDVDVCMGGGWVAIKGLALLSGSTRAITSDSLKAQQSAHFILRTLKGSRMIR